MPRHGGTWPTTEWNALVVMEKTEIDARAAFPDFKLVFTNKGEKTVRLFDDFYPLKDNGPNIFHKDFSKTNTRAEERSCVVQPQVSN